MLYLIREKPHEDRRVECEWYGIEADSIEDALDEFSVDSPPTSETVFEVVTTIAPDEYRIGYLPVGPGRKKK